MVNYTPYYKSDSIALIRGIIEGEVVDAVIMPVAPHAAVIPGKYYHTGKADRLLQVYIRSHYRLTPEKNGAYTECINLLNYSVCVIPVSTANKDIDVFDKGYKPLNEIDRKNWEACKSGFGASGIAASNGSCLEP